MIMWHQTENSKFSHSRTCEFAYHLTWVFSAFTVLTEHIIDVREGQKSDGFNKYPYEEMEHQSLSVFVEEEKQSKLLIYTSWEKGCMQPYEILGKKIKGGTTMMSINFCPGFKGCI